MTGTDQGNAKTLNIRFFESYAQLAPPTYSQEFTESLKDEFLRQTSLDLVSSGGDIIIEGEIIGYDQRATAVSGEDAATQNRLSVRVKVRYTNTLDSEQDFERTFTAFEDFPADQNLASIESTLTALINERISQDIITAALGNW